jgi:hypothetical protein
LAAFTQGWTTTLTSFSSTFLTGTTALSQLPIEEIVGRNRDKVVIVKEKKRN